MYLVYHLEHGVELLSGSWPWSCWWALFETRGNGDFALLCHVVEWARHFTASTSTIHSVWVTARWFGSTVSSAPGQRTAWLSVRTAAGESPTVTTRTMCLLRATTTQRFQHMVSSTGVLRWVPVCYVKGPLRPPVSSHQSNLYSLVCHLESLAW